MKKTLDTQGAAEALTLECGGISSLGDSLTVDALVRNSTGTAVQGRLAAAVYIGGRSVDFQLDDVPIPGGNTSRKLILSCPSSEREAGAVTVKLFLLDNDFRPLTGAVAVNV